MSDLYNSKRVHVRFGVNDMTQSAWVCCIHSHTPHTHTHPTHTYTHTHTRTRARAQLTRFTVVARFGVSVCSGDCVCTQYSVLSTVYSVFPQRPHRGVDTGGLAAITHTDAGAATLPKCVSRRGLTGLNNAACVTSCVSAHVNTGTGHVKVRLRTRQHRPRQIYTAAPSDLDT